MQCLYLKLAAFDLKTKSESTEKGRKETKKE